MPVAKHNGPKETCSTLLELVLQLHGDFRRSLAPILVTPLQAGVMLYLHRRADVRLMEAAAALRVKPPTLVEVVQDLVRKRWVTNRRSVEDRRAVCLRLSRRGEVLALQIEQRVHQVDAMLTEHDECVLGINPQGNRV